MIDDNIQRLTSQLHSMPEWKRMSQIKHFSLSLDIFVLNTNELLNLIRLLNEPNKAIEFWALKNKGLFGKTKKEIARLLHNFVASSSSLVDHSREFYKINYSKNDVFKDYKTEVHNRFAKDPLSQFIQRLRNYILHYKMPLIRSELNMKLGKAIESKQYILKNEISKFNWGKTATIYLKSAPEKIDLKHIVLEYHDKVKHFYDWMHSRLQKIHHDDLSIIHKLENEINSEYGKLIPQILKIDLLGRDEHFSPPEEIFYAFIEPDIIERIMSTEHDPVIRSNKLMDILELNYNIKLSSRCDISKVFCKYYKCNHEAKK